MKRRQPPPVSALVEHRREQARVMLEAIAAEHGMPASPVSGRSRDAEVVRARHAWWVALRSLGWSYQAIGAVVGVDHTTVLVAVRRVEPTRRARVA